MATFDPEIIVATFAAREPFGNRVKFVKDWNLEVKKLVEKWTKARESSDQPIVHDQLVFAAQVVQYMNYITHLPSAGKSFPNADKTIPITLPANIPLYGPRFIPPGYLDVQKRHASPDIKPKTAYLKPLHIIHPFYYPQLRACPRCGSEQVTLQGFTTTSYRLVHGVSFEETALGCQVRCRPCSDARRLGDLEGPCNFATTNCLFWENWDPNAIPRGIPMFFKRCAVTRDLYKLLIEMRPSMTAGKLEEHIKQLHLLEYKERMLEYLVFFKVRSMQISAAAPRLHPYSEPYDENGYRDQSITADMISEVYQGFGERSRRDESIKYTRTLDGECLSMDACFKAPKRGAVVVDSKGARHRVGKGGILSVINERSEIVAWRVCQTKKGAEMTELLSALRTRYEILGVPLPWGFIVDDCCAMRPSIEAAMKDVLVLLDIFHCIARYTAVILGGKKNPLRGTVAREIRDSLLKEGATPDKPATYWARGEQEEKLVATYEKWLQHGGIWSAAAPKCHACQLEHVQNGCLTRLNQNIRSDGSRIESLNRQWNAVIKHVASGLANYLALSYDFVLRKNIRTAMRNPREQRSDFVESTYGSHYVGLVDYVARLWNCLYEESKAKGTADHLDEAFQPLPVLKEVLSGETFGLALTQGMASLCGKLDIKELVKIEDDDEPLVLEDALDESTSPHEAVSETALLKAMDIDPALLLVPLEARPDVSTNPSPLTNGPVTSITPNRGGEGGDGGGTP
ncbi:hypothetical protein NLI96_g10403 [Meripilus lineatus]|uniref:Uncharacterized protein n=1 Tax=Meripilus lineatus TaxID=2056292 RepID=A0AAD5UTQ8_9APHY|nr:hypothetical protein NLI96_g10403 [Physisporinus lineatus]